MTQWRKGAEVQTSSTYSKEQKGSEAQRWRVTVQDKVGWIMQGPVSYRILCLTFNSCCSRNPLAGFPRGEP